MTNNLNWQGASDAINNAGTILLVTHIDPDGDAIGSLLGLANALRARGKTVDAVVDGGVPASLQFLPGAETVLSSLTQGEWDVMVSLDSSDEPRTGEAGVYGRAHSRLVINVDHHPTNTGFGDLHLVMPEAVSTTEIVLAWLRHMGQEITPDIARPLLTGLVTDTRGFRTSNVRASTLGEAQRLMEAGASLTEVTQRVLDSHPYELIELWKYALPSVTLQGAVISGVITQEDLRRAGADEKTNGDMVSLLNSVTQAMIAVVFREKANGDIEISLRSKPGYDVSQVAFSLGGGGHRQAAGATIPGPLEAARERVMPLLQAAAREGSLVIS
ncbi:MAG: bifunctional oligoribonuclease/PAP phosphatase NrnA [Chloroflexota bacterium]